MNALCEPPPARPSGATPSAAPPSSPPAGHAAGSCLYECRVRHHRFAPREHAFAYRLFYLGVELDELPALARRLRMFRAGVFSLRERDYLPLGETPHRPADSPANAALARSRAAGAGTTLAQRVAAFCAAHGVALGAQPRVHLVTLPRVLGYQFNPVSFYFCFSHDGTPRAAIAEVTNTFREVKPFFIPVAGEAGTAGFRLRAPKHFYVSPFSPVEAEFDFDLRAPAGKLAVSIDIREGGRRTLHATLTGGRAALTDARLAWFFVKYPVVTLGVVARIHWQALRLWLRRVPFFRKADSPGGQRDLYRPDASLSARPPP